MKRRSLKQLLKLGYKVNYICYDCNWREWRVNVITENGNTWFFFKNLPVYVKFENLLHNNTTEFENENRTTKVNIYWE